MKISDRRIDHGKAFDWGKAAKDYALYRDIYPPQFYQKIIDRGLCLKGQKVLDLGTGSGVLPRNLYRYGASWIGTDLSSEQIEEAKRLAAHNHQKIDFLAVKAEDLVFPDESFDVITACQCFWYFDHERLMGKLARFLKPQGKLLILYMSWLPFEDPIASQSEALVLKYNPEWSGAGETRHPIVIPEAANDYFQLIDHEEYDLLVPFTRDSWHGRMRACRGVGASLSAEELSSWDETHRALLECIAPEQFDILHYGALALLEKK